MQREKQFIADASHDLKTPLSVILANNAILLENPEAPVGSVRRWVDSSQEAAKRMQQLISQMLTLADVERPDAVLPQSPVLFPYRLLPGGSFRQPGRWLSVPASRGQAALRPEPAAAAVSTS